MNIKKNEEDKVVRRTYSMDREIVGIIEERAKEKHLSNSGYIRYLVLKEEENNNDR